jgi:hypothetical protein
MVAVGMTVENHLLPLAFALVEGENNENWKWFLSLVRKQVLGSDKQVCMILDCHRGLLNGAKDHLEGYPPLIYRRCSRHFCRKHLEEATEQGGYRQVEGVVQG